MVGGRSPEHIATGRPLAPTHLTVLLRVHCSIYKFYEYEIVGMHSILTDDHSSALQAPSSEIKVIIFVCYWKMTLPVKVTLASSLPASLVETQTYSP